MPRVPQPSVSLLLNQIALSDVTCHDTPRCSTVCSPGYGGPQCKRCSAGSWSAGGNASVATPECAACPSGGCQQLAVGRRFGVQCKCWQRCPPGKNFAASFSALWEWAGGAAEPRPFHCLQPAGYTTSGSGASSQKDCAVKTSGECHATQSVRG